MIQPKMYPTKLCALLFILVSLLLTNWSMDSATVQAQAANFNTYYSYNPFVGSLQTRMSWEVNITFEETDIQSVWILRVEQQPSNTDPWHLVDEFVADIPCARQGDVQIHNGMAHFDPDSHDHIICELPSFKDTVDSVIKFPAGLYLGVPSLGSEPQKISQIPELGQICTGCIDPWVAAGIQIEYRDQLHYPLTYLQALTKTVSPLLPGGTGLPIFKTEVVMNAQNMEFASLSTYMSGWNTLERSQEFMAYDPQALWSGMNAPRFHHTLAERNSGHPTAWTTAWEYPDSEMALYGTGASVSTSDWLSWSQSISGPQSVSPHQPYVMSTDAMVLYIGHNPDTGQFFSGSMKNIAADPGCIGH